MKKKIEITLKVNNETEAQDLLEIIGQQILNAGFDKAPNDIREFEDGDGVHGYHYEVYDNDGTDMYGNKIE